IKKKHQQTERNNAGRDWRAFKIFDLARRRRKRLGGDVVTRQTTQSANGEINQDDLIETAIEADRERDRGGGGARRKHTPPPGRVPPQRPGPMKPAPGPPPPAPPKP